MTSGSANVPVPTPANLGTCTAFVEAAGYQSGSKIVFLQNYTQCIIPTLEVAQTFNSTNNATFTTSYPRSGPLGYLQIEYIVNNPANISLTYDTFGGEISIGGISQLFYKSVCTGSGRLWMTITGTSSDSMTDPNQCEFYVDRNNFQPYTTFNNFYGIQAQTSYTYTTYLFSTAASGASGSLDTNSATVCLAANYIAAQTGTSFVFINSTLSFSAYLGVSQSMSAQGAARLTCNSHFTTTTFTLTDSNQTFTIEPPQASSGDQCTLYVYNDPENEAYAAPINLYLTAKIMPSLTLTVSNSAVSYINKSMWLAFLALVIGLTRTLLALPYLTLEVPEDPAVTYFNTAFTIGTSEDSLPQVKCTIECPGGLVSTVLSQSTSFTAEIELPVPGYNGTCLASVEAVGYQSAFTNLTVLNHTQCQVTSVFALIPFNSTNDALISIDYPLSGPLGNIFIYYLVFPPNLNNTISVNSFSGLLTKDTNSQLFYHNCTNTSLILLIGLSHGGSASLVEGNCSTSFFNANSPTIFNPYTPFNQLYRLQAQGQYNFTTFLNPWAPNGTNVVFYGILTQICLSANYIVVNTTSDLLIPDSTFTFIAYLGLNQSMATVGAAELTCGSQTTSVSFNLTNTPEEITISTPSRSSLDNCLLYVFNDPESQSYAAPVKIFLTSAYLTLEVSSDTVSAGNVLAYEVYVGSDPSVGYLAALNLYCGNQLLVSENVTTSSSTQYFNIPNTAIGVCQFNASNYNNSYGNSNTVSLTVNQQLNIASSLTDWT